MVLSWEGTSYYLLAVSTTNPEPTPYSDCAPFGFPDDTSRSLTPSKGAYKMGPGRELPQELKKALEARKGKVAAVPTAENAEITYNRDESQATKIYLSVAELYHGPATLSSRKYNIKYRTGDVVLCTNGSGSSRW